MIKIIGLLENTTAANADLKCKHGLSLYIQTDKHKILFDVGPDDLFVKNAQKLGVDIADVDIAVISHGHVDHCGGLKHFLHINRKAAIYIRSQAVEPHYFKVLGVPFYAGIDKKLACCDRFVFTDEHCVVDDEIMLFSDVSGNFPLPRSDSNLFVWRDGKIVADDFRHEQNLVVNSCGNNVLVCGCTHAGIVNIVEQSRTVAGAYPTAVVGGFHLYEPTSKRYERADYIDNVAKRLAATGATFYTCHCTGTKAYEQLKLRLGDRLSYLHTGTKICI